MKRGLIVLLPLLLFSALVFAAEMLRIDAKSILPDNFNTQVEDARKQSEKDRQLLAALRNLTNRGWKLSDPYLKRFHIIPPEELYFSVPERYRPAGKLAEILDPDNLFTASGIRYSDEAYQKMRRREEDAELGKDGDKDTQKGQDKDGWQWDISNDIKLVLRGSQNINMAYGFDNVDQNLKSGDHVRRVGVRRNFLLAQDLDLSLVGRVGPKIKVSIDHNSRRKDNKYDISYSGDEDEVVREIKAGNIDLSIPGSKYVVYSGGSKSAFGLKTVLASERFKLQAVLSLTRGVTETKTFTGKSSRQEVIIRDVAYVKHKYYMLPDREIDNNSLHVYLTTDETNQSVSIGGGIYRLLRSGADYSFNPRSGELVMDKPVTRDQNLIVSYTVNGADPPGSSHPHGSFSGNETVDVNGRRYVYMKRIGYYSRFERKGVYKLGYSNIDVTRGFEFYVINTDDGARSTEAQFSSDEYSLDGKNGLLEFYALEPFDGKPNIPEALYHAPNDPQTADSVYSLKFVFMHRVDTFQLDFNVLEGSEIVKVNGAVQQRNQDYRINYMTGSLTFMRVINENDSIEVTYEYKPFSSSLQRTLFGSRVDFKVLPGWNLGATLVYSGGQKPTGAPTPLNPPDSSLLFDFDTRVDFLKMFGVGDKDWSLFAEAEYAYSVHDKNTVDQALLADMENDLLGHAMTRSENSWYPGSPSPNIDGLSQDTRGLLLYRDYRDYGLNDNYTLKSYQWPDLPADQVYSYERKPGPYTAQGGRNESTLEIAENSLAFEYDFRNNKQWVSAVCSIAGPGGKDLSRIKQLLLSLKHQSYGGNDGNGNALYEDSPGGDVRFFVEIGQLHEDADGDQVFDREETPGSGGWLFNPPGSRSTRVGGGRRNAGNGRIDSEDLNGDSLFTTNESSVLFPADGFTERTNLSIPSGEGWQEFSLDIQNLGSGQLAILEKANAVRITLVKGSAERGRLLMDRAYFKGSRWENVTIDGQSVMTADEFMVNVLSTRENAEYRENRIYPEHSERFEDLHGRLSSAEEAQLNEKALQIKYNLSSQSRISNQYGNMATTTKVFNHNMDFSYYKELIFYAYVKEKAGHTNEFLILRLENSDTRYYEWRIPLSELTLAADAAAAGDNKWQKLSIILNEKEDRERFHIYYNDRDIATGTKTARSPNLRAINRVTVGIDVSGTDQTENRGEIWLNEVHLFEDITRTGSALSLRAEFSSREKNIARLWGLPLLGPFAFKFELNDVGLGFRSIGQAGEDEASWALRFSGSLNLVEYLDFSATYNGTHRYTDQDREVLPLQLQSADTNSAYSHSLRLRDAGGYFPSFTHTYSRTLNKKLQHQLQTTGTDETNEVIIDRVKQQYAESAVFKLQGRLPLNFVHNYTIRDSYFLDDMSVRSNGRSPGWFTNNSSRGTATFAKRESYNIAFRERGILGQARSRFSVSTSFFREQERYNEAVSEQGMRDELDRLEGKPILRSYRDRAEELFSGIGTLPATLDGTNRNMEQSGTTVKASLKNFGVFNLNLEFSRSGKDSNYVELTNTIFVHNNASSAKAALETRLLFREGFLRNISMKLDRNFTFSETTGLLDKDTIWDNFKKPMLSAPFHYLGFFKESGRHNAVDFVSRLGGAEGKTYVTLRNSLHLSSRFDFGDGFLGAVIPDDYQYNLSLYTARSLSSYIQNRDWTFSVNKDFPLKKLGFWVFDEEKGSKKRVRPLRLKFKLGNKYDYNTKIIDRNISTSLATGIRWTRYSTFKLTYIFKHSYLRQSLYADDEGYVYMGIGEDSGAGTGDSFGDLEEQADGSAPGFSEQSSRREYSHIINILFTFPSYHEGPWKIFGIEIPVDDTWQHNNQIQLRFAGTDYELNRSGTYSFNEIFERPFYLLLQHSVDYDFSKSWNANFYIKAIFEKWDLVQPDTKRTGLTSEDYDLSFGMEIGLKMQIRF